MRSQNVDVELVRFTSGYFFEIAANRSSQKGIV